MSAFADQEGFTVRDANSVVAAVDVPCLLQSGAIGFCTIETSYDSANGTPTQDVGGAVHGVRVTLDEASDGRVYHANGEPIGNHIGGDGESWCQISIRKGDQGSPDDDASARDLVHRYAKQIMGSVAEAGHSETAFLARRGPFKIPNTFEARASVAPVQDRIRDQRIAIIGLGGTGAYVLDLMAKTPVVAIHLLDRDTMDWHNLMRAPGAPTTEEIQSLRKERPLKVDYYHAKYGSLREGIHPHPIMIDGPATLAAFVSTHPLDFAFVCIDQRKDCDSPRQDEVYAALSHAGVPFLDSGVSITLENNQVFGAVTTSAYASGSTAWKEAVPNARVDGDVLGYRNVQLPEVNALAAALAVMEWRRRTGQYASESVSFLHKFRLESGSIKRAK